MEEEKKEIIIGERNEGTKVAKGKTQFGALSFFTDLINKFKAGMVADMSGSAIDNFHVRSGKGGYFKQNQRTTRKLSR